MRSKSLILTVLLLFFGVRPVFASHVVINEVYYDVDSTHGQETNNEWIELFNTSTSDVDLTGWTITDNSSSRTLASAIIKANSTLVITAQSSTWNFWNITGDKIALNANLGNGLSNDGDKLLLKDSSGIEHDKLSYGSNSDYLPSLPDVNEGHSLERIPAGLAFVDQSSPTPGVASTSIFSPTPSPSPSTSSSPSPSSTSTSTSSFTISSIPSQIDSTETFNVFVNLSLSNKPNTTFYLKGAFKKQDKTNYFGLTKVNESWIRNNKSYLDHVKITTDSQGFWSGNLEIQPDILDSGYEGAGEYIFKVGRYTDSGSLTWSNEVTIRINAQEIVLEDSDSDILGISGTQNNKVTTKSPKKEKEEYSLEKYIKIATPVAKATTSANSSVSAEVKSQQRINYFSWTGVLMIVGGTLVLTFVYLRNNNLREAISNLFRKRN